MIVPVRPARRIAIVGISGNGKTTLARAAAKKLGVAHVELDRLYHLPGWIEAETDAFRAAADAETRAAGWVADGSYYAKLDLLVHDRADEVVWLDQPLSLVLLRLLRRTIRDVVTRRDMFNGNRQTLRLAFWGRDSLFRWAVRAHFRHRREWPVRFAASLTPVTRLRSPAAVAEWLDDL